MMFRMLVPGSFQIRMARSLREMLFGNGSDIHYIGGAEILPAPFEPEEETEWIGKLENEEERQQAISVLVEHNLRLVVYIAKKFDNTGVGVEDLISIGTIGLMKAINTFRTDKNIKLATYASRCICCKFNVFVRTKCIYSLNKTNSTY